MQDTAEAAAERDQVAAGILPARYGVPWQQPFLDRVGKGLRPGVRILDVGSGARPVVPPGIRPPNCHYAGLDVSVDELDRAGPAAYDERIVADIAHASADIQDRFDLVVSWQVLEHVASMRAALDAQYRALADGGRMVAMLSGALGAYALLALSHPSTGRALSFKSACWASTVQTSFQHATTPVARASWPRYSTSVAGAATRSLLCTRVECISAFHRPCRACTCATRTRSIVPIAAKPVTHYIIDALR